MRWREKYMFKPFGILEEVASPYNGKIVILGGIEGPRILVGGLSQSGWLVRKIWKSGIKRIKQEIVNPERILILGLGGGSSSELTQEYFPNAHVKGIEIDPKMVEMGKKYLKLGEITNLEIIIADVREFLPKVKSAIRRKKAKPYDLILVDLFVGTKIPEEFKEEKFLLNLLDISSTRSIIAFNHFYAYSDREEAIKFSQKLRKVFPKIISVTEEANIIFLCFKN